MKKHCGGLSALFVIIGAVVFVASVTVAVVALMRRFRPEIFLGGECCCDDEWDDEFDFDDDDSEDDSDEDAKETDEK